MESAALHLEKSKTEYPGASHYCYAYILDKDGDQTRVNDDGEPNNSAGHPIYRQILSRGLSEVMVVVVRFFGGKKLGIPGLISSYGECARLALEDAKIAIVEEMLTLSIRDVNGNDYLIFSFVKRYNGVIINQADQPGRWFHIEFPLGIKDELMASFKELPNFDWTEGHHHLES